MIEICNPVAPRSIQEFRPIAWRSRWRWFLRPLLSALTDLPFVYDFYTSVLLSDVGASDATVLCFSKWLTKIYDQPINFSTSSHKMLSVIFCSPFFAIPADAWSSYPRQPAKSESCHLVGKYCFNKNWRSLRDLKRFPELKRGVLISFFLWIRLIFVIQLNSPIYGKEKKKTKQNYWLNSKKFFQQWKHWLW